MFERFVKVGLKSERELYDIIQENIRNGQELEIERDMLRSIIRTCEDSGVKIEEINPRAGSWGGSYRDRMKEIGLAEGYPFFQGMSSQAVHGSWSDLVRNYLNKSETGYEPSRVPGSGVRGRGSGERETTASSLAGKEENSRKEDNSGQGKDGPAGAIAQGGNGR